MQLCVKGIKFKYNSHPILNDVCMDASGAEIVGIVGPNGAGKSTLIKCIDRILVPQGGGITIDGDDIYRMNRLAFARKLGYIPQKVSSLFSMTVFDTILMGRRPHMGWRVTDSDIEKVGRVLKQLHIEHLAMKDFNECSGGEQQKIYIARALAQETDLLLLDEPTSNLDIRHQLEVLNTIRGIVKEKGITAIVAIHDLNLATRYCDRILLLKKGQIYAAGDPATVFTEDNIRAVYGVEAIVRHDMSRPFIIPVSPV